MSSSSGYVVTCHMPHKTPFTAPVRGPVCPGKKQAKRGTALQICGLLHQLGELDNYLKVKKKEVFIEDEEDEDMEYNPNQRKMGTRRKRNFYQKKQPGQLQCEDEGPFFLHTVKIILKKTNDHFKYAQYFPEKDESSLGFLTSTVLPHFGPFDLHLPSGLHSALVLYSKQIFLTSHEMRLIKLFHQYIFSSVLKITTLMNFEGKDLLVMPLNNGELDYKSLNKFAEKKSPKKLRLSHEFDQSVIYPTYKMEKVHYFVEEKIPFLNINSKIPNETYTFKEYFLNKYGKKLEDESQPLLRISSADKRSYMLVSSNSKTRQKSKKDLYNTTLFVPELMAEEHISAGLWKQAQMLPFILHRASSLISASTLLTDLRYPGAEDNLALDSLPPATPANSFACLLKADQNRSLDIPSAGNILQALTLRAANDCFDMERLEVLGDVFLKFSSGIFLYYKSIEQGAVSADEGDLTTKRSRVVGNKNLFKIAESNHLHHKIVCVQMESHTTWRAPGFERLELEKRLIDLDSKFLEYLNGEKRSTLSVGSLLSWLTEEDLEGMKCKTDEEVLAVAAERCMNNDVAGIKLKCFQLLSDKSQADCVEALIGIFLLKSGQPGALQFMARIGINLSAENSTENLLNRVTNQAGQFQHFQPQSDAFIDAHVRLSKQQNASSLYAKLDARKIESIIGYTFRERSFLLQAFTHASYSDNRLTESYEKLEYLGDAVLDYLVSAYIYTHTTADPGKITDIRSALVNNNMFASIIVKNQLHPYILHYTPMLQNKIQAYIEDREKDIEDNLKDKMASDEEEINRSLGLINEVEPPELEMVEVPKVLGDVFESLIGAVYLDTSHDLEKVWEVYCRLCPQLDLVVEHPPVNMKKQLMEKFPSKVTFCSKPSTGPKVTVSAKISVGKRDYEFKGLGLNKALATLAACKLALRKLK
jgi:dsRNA-specific ribonuclease